MCKVPDFMPCVSSKKGVLVKRLGRNLADSLLLGVVRGAEGKGRGLVEEHPRGGKQKVPCGILITSCSNICGWQVMLKAFAQDSGKPLSVGIKETRQAD